MANLKSFIMFVSVALLVYTATNYYIYRRAVQAASAAGWAGVALRVVLLTAILAYPLGRALGGSWGVSKIFIWVGSFWFAAMSYSLLIVLLVDLIRFGDLLTGWLPSWVLGDRIQSGRMVFAVSAVMIGMLLLGGHIRSLYPVIHEVPITLDKLSPERGEYRIALFADTHLGELVGERRMSRIADQVNNLNVNLCLIVGDLVDESPKHLEWAVEPLKKLTAPDGVWAVTGNHEFYAGIEESTALMERAGIKLLRDSVVEIPGELSLIGLDDVTGSRQFQRSVKPISELVGAANRNLPTLLMHHSPLRLQEAERAGVDLMISGHTHRGQIWPFGYIAQAVYGVDTGLTQIGRMKFYLTTGAGTWGPPVRVGARPEIVVLVLKPRESKV